MKDLDLKHIIASIEPIVREAGLTALSLQDNLGDIKYKTAKDVVTAADIASEKIIVEGIQKAFPKHSIRTEEAGVVSLPGADPDILWVIDPVDGTVNFSRGIPFWGVSAGLQVCGKSVGAVCFLPRLGEMYLAYKDGGAYLNGKRIHVSDTSDIAHAIVTNGDFNVGIPEKINKQNSKNFSAEAAACMRVKCYGSAVAEGCSLACGRFDGFVMTMSYPWDITGIACIIEEAGGKATHIDGTDMQFVDAEQVLFSNGILHNELVKVLNG